MEQASGELREGNTAWQLELDRVCVCVSRGVGKS